MREPTWEGVRGQGRQEGAEIGQCGGVGFVEVAELHQVGRDGVQGNQGLQLGLPSEVAPQKLLPQGQRCPPIAYAGGCFLLQPSVLDAATLKRDSSEVLSAKHEYTQANNA